MLFQKGGRRKRKSVSTRNMNKTGRRIQKKRSIDREAQRMETFMNTEIELSEYEKIKVALRSATQH